MRTTAFLFVTCCFVGTAWANQLERAIAQIATQNKASAQSQKKIDKLADQTQQLLERYRATQRQTSSLNTYNSQLQGIVDAQTTEIDSLQQQINDVTLVARQITPLMLRMIDSVDAFVGLDLPFLLEERRKRVAHLRAIMSRADVSIAEKLRKVLEAYQIENDYGRTIEGYKGSIQASDGERVVSILRLGRVALYYQTLDAKSCGTWNRRAQSWQALPGKNCRAIKVGLRMANKQTAPDLLILPIPAPQVTP